MERPARSNSAIATRLAREFLEADTRGLAVFRFFYGLALLWCVVSRTLGDRFLAFHTDYGVLPGPLAIERPATTQAWSLLFGLGKPPAVALFFLVAAIFCVWLAVGYRTRTAAIGSYVAILSLHFRNHYVVNGAMSILAVLGLFVIALPLGRHYSVDAWRRRRRGEAIVEPATYRVRSLGFLAFRFEVVCLYLFNVLHKSGTTWREGTAVHYVLHDDRLTLITAKWLRDVLPRWVSPVATYSVLVAESLIVLALLSPFATKHARRFAVGLIVVLHVGIGAVLQIGPFPAVLPSVALLLLAGDDFSGFHAAVSRRIARLPRLARFWTALDPAEDPVRAPVASDRLALAASTGAREVYFACVLSLLVALNLKENPSLRRWLPDFVLPAPMEFAKAFLDLRHSWALFAPDAPVTSSYFVVDLELEDGRHVDPLTHARPDFDRFGRGPYGTDYFWQSYQPRLVMMRSDDRLWSAFVDYLGRIPVLERWTGERRVRSIEVWVMAGRTPAPGEPYRPAERRLLARRDARAGLVRSTDPLPPIDPPLGSTQPSAR